MAHELKRVRACFLLVGDHFIFDSDTCAHGIATGNIYDEKQLTEKLEKAHKTGNWSKFNTHKTGIKARLMVR